MTTLTTEQIRGLYSNADHYEEKHARASLNGAEFDDWLQSHDGKLTGDLLASIAAELEALDLGQGDSHALWPTIVSLKERAEKAVDRAAAKK